jgi:hypothetical protein
MSGNPNPSKGTKQRRGPRENKKRKERKEGKKRLKQKEDETKTLTLGPCGQVNQLKTAKRICGHGKRKHVCRGGC